MNHPIKYRDHVILWNGEVYEIREESCSEVLMTCPSPGDAINAIDDVIDGCDSGEAARELAARKVGEEVTADLRGLLRAAGFEVWNTGGGCEAYAKQVSRGVILVTDGDGNLPDVGDVYLSRYPTEEYDEADDQRVLDATDLLGVTALIARWTTALEEA